MTLKTFRVRIRSKPCLVMLSTVEVTILWIKCILNINFSIVPTYSNLIPFSGILEGVKLCKRQLNFSGLVIKVSQIKSAHCFRLLGPFNRFWRVNRGKNHLPSALESPVTSHKISKETEWGGIHKLRWQDFWPPLLLYYISRHIIVDIC